MEKIDIENLSIEELRMEFGDCDWMRAFLNGYAVDAVLWLMDRVEELEQLIKEQESTHRLCKKLMKLQEQGAHFSEMMDSFDTMQRR